MRRFALPLLLLAAAQTAFGAYADRDLMIPVVGRASGGTGRLFQTALWITNADDHRAVLTLSYLESGHANPSPRKTSIALAPGETHVFDPLGPPILTSINSIGALRIESNADVTASARIYGYLPSVVPNSSASPALTSIPTPLPTRNAPPSLLHPDPP